MYPEAEKILLVEDNLNIHRDASLYENFEPEKARRLASKIERHHTPKHGSWLNIAEIEIAALTRSCLKERIASTEDFHFETTAYASRKNDKAVPVRWQFTTADARTKLRSLYPSL